MLALARIQQAPKPLTADEFAGRYSTDTSAGEVA
jgi:hypothetical protein